MINKQLIDQCYQESLKLLRQNRSDAGVLASSGSERSHARHYNSIFGRDASICALGMVASREPDLIETARLGLVTLAKHQGVNGQIPKYVKLKVEVDFWYTGCIDATLWWLIAIRLTDRWTAPGGLTETLSEEVSKALQWLLCQEHQVWYLLQQNEASDWADIMPRSGFVLYTNCLWYWTKRLYGLSTAGETRLYANLLLSPHDNKVPTERRIRVLRHFVKNKCRPTAFFLSFVNLSFWGEEVDVFGNILAYLTELGAPSCAEKLASALTELKVNDPFPIRVVGKPIGPDAPQWRYYMQRHQQNYPWQYHNGGIWPFVGGFWVLLLAKLGHDQQAWHELGKVANACQVSDWEFNEWFHGQTGAPMGMSRQSWNAALFILAYQTLSNKHSFRLL